MTAENDFKRLVRARMARTGESYQAARRSLLDRHSKEETLSTYDSTAIEEAGSLTHIRRHPGRYIMGTSGEGVTHLVLEVLANSLDEASSGHASQIEVVLNEDGSISITDDGRGIPVDRVGPDGPSALELAVTRPGAGAKHHSEHYRLPAGENGLGLPVVAALSSWLEVIVDRDGSRHRARFESDDESPAQVSEATQRTGPAERASGTTVSFLPDPEVFGDARVDIEALAARARTAAALNPGLSLTVHDRRVRGKSWTQTVVEPTGLVSLLPAEARPVAKRGSASADDGTAEVAVAPSVEGGSWRAFVNGHETAARGDHVDAVLAALGQQSAHVVISVRLPGRVLEASDGQFRLRSARGAELALAALRDAGA